MAISKLSAASPGERAAPKRRRRARGTDARSRGLHGCHSTTGHQNKRTMVAPLTLICPPGAKPGQQLLFKDDDGQRFTTEVPKGVRPGMKFLAHRKALGTGYVGKDGVRFSKVASQSKLRARQPTPMPSAAPSQRSSRQPSATARASPRLGASEARIRTEPSGTSTRTERRTEHPRLRDPSRRTRRSATRSGSSSSALVERFLKRKPEIMATACPCGRPTSAIRRTT